MAPATARSALVVGEIVVTPAVGRLIVQGALDPVPYLRRHLARIFHKKGRISYIPLI